MKLIAASTERTIEYYDDEFNSVNELFRRAINLKNTGQFAKLWYFLAKMRHYSIYNTSLVYAQNDGVTFFGSAAYWKKNFQRTINEDARVYIMIAPMHPVLYAYDVYDTSGVLTPDEFVRQGVGFETLDKDKLFNKEIFYRALNNVKGWGIPVIIKPQYIAKGGHITTIFAGKLEIVINERRELIEQFQVLIHELAHLLLGHTRHGILVHHINNQKNTLLNRKVSRELQELEAETVNYLISTRLGLNTMSAEYLSGYIKNEEMLKKFNYDLVIKTANKVETLFVK
jgi:hypothetical protein